jgi:hypothetical protein
MLLTIELIALWTIDIEEHGMAPWAWVKVSTMTCGARNLASTWRITVVAKHVNIDLFLNNLLVILVVHLHFYTWDKTVV